VLLALEYFHKNDILYRYGFIVVNFCSDLKLENILLTLDGHIKIADYGLCKEQMGDTSLTKTFCGTTQFMAPEIIRGLPYGRAVDWWAFGILIYQMVVGVPAFHGDDEEDLYEAILDDEISYPDSMNMDSVLLLHNVSFETNWVVVD
jgi:serine/threonine protein kinase